MSAVWDGMLAHEASDMGVIRADHGMAEAVAEDLAWEHARGSYGVSYKQGFRAGWWGNLAWLLQMQLRFDTLTEAEALHELRLETASIYWPLLSDARTLRFDCPTCGHQVAISKEGICDECGYEF